MTTFINCIYECQKNIIAKHPNMFQTRYRTIFNDKREGRTVMKVKFWLNFRHY